jgi:hypothetical protein
MKTLLLLCAVFSILTTGLAGEVGQSQDLSHAQVMTLDDGTKVTFLGVTYGTRHWPPDYEALGGAYCQANNAVNSYFEDFMQLLHRECGF